MQIITVLAGHSFRDKQAKACLAEVFDAADFPTECDIESESGNKYDSSAVAIYLSGEHIGYVAKTDNADLAMMLNFPETAAAMGIIAEGHIPAVTRCDIMDFVNGPQKPTILIEISTGWEVATQINVRPAEGDEPDED